MAESPESWDLITASLALCNLERPFEAWAFLAVQGLLRDEPGDRETFVQFVREEVPKEITGPTAPCRVAGRLKIATIALEAGNVRDPWARLAVQRLSLIEPWTGREDAARYLQYLQTMEVARDQPTETASLPARKQWWKFW